MSGDDLDLPSLRALEKDIDRLWAQMQTFAPLVRLEPEVDAIKDDITELKADVKKIVSESVVKQLVTISIPLLLLAAMALLTAIFTGRLPL